LRAMAARLGFNFNLDLVRGLRVLSTKSVMFKCDTKHNALWGDAYNELSIGREAYDAIEHLSDTLVNDTSRSVAASLTKKHQRARENIKAGILYRKNFRGPPELSILTSRAREQIAHLSATSPSEWDAVSVSENFPISYRGAGLLLLKQRRNPRRFFRSLDAVVEYDTRSIKNWLTLIEVICTAQVGNHVKASESQIMQVLSSRLPDGLRWIGVENVLNKLAFADGNPALPHPPQTSVEAVNFVKSQHQAGYFQRIAESFYKPIETSSESVSLREQQVSVINKLIPLFKHMDFSVFTQPLMEDTSLTFRTVCRNWLCIDPEPLQLDRSRSPRTRSKVDCDFTKVFRYKRICT
uniref:Peptidase_M3 domain-containing protein n=1 Tax=Hydatigena taeniaeformis TaxID=6205 RepID=A0A0R3WP18_HYDTA